MPMPDGDSPAQVPPPERAGTQSLLRGVALLRALATRGRFGWRLSDLAAACRLDKGTAHRILAALVHERLVQQRPSDRHYLPGPLLYELGLSLQGHVALNRRAEETLAALARRLGAIVLLQWRSGTDYVCGLRTGQVPLSALMVEPGTRRPLFTSVGGVAILQTLPPPEAAEVLQDNIAHEVERRGTDRLAALQCMRERSARHGFGVNLGDVVPSVHAFAVPLLGPGRAFAALSLMGPAERFGEARLVELRQELTAAAAVLQADAEALVFGGMDDARFNM